MEALSLSHLTSAVHEILEANFERILLVKAEISSIQIAKSGHVYLELIEKQGDTIIAKMRGNMWRNLAYENIIHFKNINNRNMRAGDELMLHVYVNYNPVYGLSLNIQKIEAEYTLGQREIQKRRLSKKIEEEGLIKQNKDLSLPPILTRIAVISSKNAAGYQDFITHLRHNGHNYSYGITLFPSLMQGNNAQKSIENAFHKIASLSHQFDVVIMTRGGGADLDLDCFSTYEVCKAIANCPLPVVTGLGHERDLSLSDECAHTYVRTPTAVADFLIQHNVEAERALLLALKSIQTHWNQYLYKKRNHLKTVLINIKETIQDLHSTEKKNLQSISNRIAKTTWSCFFNNKSKLQQHTIRIHDKSKNISSLKRTQLNALTAQLTTSIKQACNREAEFLKNCQIQMDLVNPDKILARGFTYVSKESQFITKGSKLLKGEIVTIHFKDSKKDAKIQ